MIRIFFKFLLSLGILFSLELANCNAQSTFIPLNDDYYHLIDRLEIKRGKLSEGFHSSTKPFERKALIRLTDSIQHDATIPLTNKDRYNIEHFLQDSREWTPGPNSVRQDTSSLAEAVFPSKLRAHKTFFKYPADLYTYTNEDIDLHVNFTTNNFIGTDNTTFEWGENHRQLLNSSTRGVELRGTISKKLGFYTYVADTQGNFPQYIQDYTAKYNFPSEGSAKMLRRTGVDFMTARGYVTFNPIKNINVQFGHDRNFIGSGYRSLLLSDNSAPYLFLKLETHLGRFHYTNLFTSMINSQDQGSRDHLRAKKYSAMHHLSININERLNIGVFEAEVFTRDSTGGNYELNYLNPIIFYRFVESYLGSEDNALLGFDFRWLAARKFSFYGQLMLDEFLTKSYFSKDIDWTRKYALQMGGKYLDVAGVPNLDLQVEYNVVRPYTYSHRDGSRNYAHFNQSLAHPLGANFKEILGILRYQFSPKLSFYYTLMHTTQGLDYDGRNWGSNILLDYDTRVSNSDNKIGQGRKVTTILSDLRASYMLFHNLFIDGRFLLRNATDSNGTLVQKSNILSVALRYNIPYRQQTF
jgi:hypothetical protein